jgi:hypothetical protein
VAEWRHRADGITDQGQNLFGFGQLYPAAAQAQVIGQLLIINPVQAVGNYQDRDPIG